MGDFRIKMISCKLISTKEILALKKKMAYNAEKNKQTNKTNTGKSYKKFYLQTFGEKRILPKPNHPYPPPPASTPQKSNGRPLFSENSESCASFQTRRTRRLVEKNNNNNQNFLLGNLDLQGQCVCKQKKVPLFTKSLL